MTLTAAHITAGYVYVATGTLTNGSAYAINAKVIDVAGNASSASASTTVTVDTTPPAAPTITVRDDVGSLTSNNLANNARTDDTNLSVRVTLPTTGSLAVAGDKVQLYNNTTALGSAVTLTAAHITAGYVYVATGTLTNGSAYAINAKVIDAAGNASSPSASTTVTVDTTAPTISSVTLTASGAQNGYLNVGDTVTVTLTFSEAVTVTGKPPLTLTIGNTDVWAYYSSGSGTQSLIFTYQIRSGQVDSDGIALKANSLRLISGTNIRDTAGNALTNLNHAGLANQSAYRVDALIATPTLQVNFVSNTITVGGLENGASWQYTTNNGTSWTAVASGNTLPLPLNTLSTYRARVRQTDLAGNVSLPGKTLLEGLLPEQITQIGTAVLGQFQQTDFNSLSLVQLQALNGAGLNENQLAFVLSAQGGRTLLQSLSATQTANLAPAQFGLLSEAELGTLSVAQVGMLDQTQINSLTVVKLQKLNVAGLTAAQLQADYSYVAPKLMSVASVQIQTVAVPSVLSTLAAADVPQLNPVELAACSDAKLGTMSTAQMAYLTREQIKLFSLSQIRAFDVSGFVAQQLGYLIASGDSVIESLDSSDMASLSAEAIAHMSAAAVAELTDAQLTAILTAGSAKFNSLNGAGLGTGLTAQLGTQALINALSVEQIAALQPSVLAAKRSLIATRSTWAAERGSITPRQIAQLSGAELLVFFPATSNYAAMTAMTAAQEAALTRDQLIAMTTNGLQALTGDGLSITQLGYTLDDGTPVLSWLLNAQLANLSPTTVAALSVEQIQGLGAAQIDQFSANKLGLLNASQVTAMGTRLSRLSVAKLNALTPDAIAGLTTEQLATVLTTVSGTPTLLQSLSNSQVAALKPSVLAGLTSSAQLAVLRGLTASQVGSLTEMQLNALSTAQLHELTNPGFTAVQLRYHNVKYWGHTILNHLQDAQLHDLPIATVPTLSVPQLVGMHPERLNKFSNNQLLALTAHQVSVLSLAQVRALSSNQRQQLNGAGITPRLRLYTVSDSDATKIFAVGSLTNNQITALRADTVEAFTTAGHTWSDAHVALMGAEALSGLGAAGVNTYFGDATNGQTRLQALSTNKLNALNVSLFSGTTLLWTYPASTATKVLQSLTPGQVGSLQASVLSGNFGMLSSTQVGGLTSGQLSTLTESQIRAITAVGGWTSSQLGYLTATANTDGVAGNKTVWKAMFADGVTTGLSSLSVETVGQLTNANGKNQLSLLSVAQARLLNAAGLTYSQLSENIASGTLWAARVGDTTSNAWLGQLSLDTVRQLTNANSKNQLGLLSVAQARLLNATGLTYSQLSETVTGGGTLWAARVGDTTSNAWLGQLSLDTVRQLTNANSKNQLGLLSVAQARLLNAAGLTHSQLSETVTGGGTLWAARVGDASNTWLGQLSPETVGQLTSGQLLLLTEAQVQHLNTAGLSFEQLGYATATVKSANVKKTVWEALVATTGATATTWLPNLPSATRASLTTEQIAAILPAHLASLSERQLAQLNTDQVGALVLAQLRALNSFQIAALNTAGLTAVQVIMRNVADNQFLFSVGGMSNIQIAHLQPATVAALTKAQINTLTTEQIQLLDARGLSYEQLNYLNASQTATLFESLTDEQRHDLMPETLAGLTDDQWIGMISDHFDHLSPAQLGVLRPWLVQNVLSSLQIKRLSLAQLQSLNATGLTKPQLLADFNNNPGTLVLQNLSLAQVASLSNAVLISLIDENQPHLLFTPTQVSALTIEQIAGLSANQLSLLPASGWSYAQLVTAPSTGSTLWTKLLGISKSWLAALSPQTVGELQGTEIDDLTAAEVTSLSASGWAGRAQLMFDTSTYITGSAGAKKTVWDALLGVSDKPWLANLSETAVGELQGTEIDDLTAADVRNLLASGWVGSAQLIFETSTFKVGNSGAKKTVWDALLESATDNWVSQLSAATVTSLTSTTAGQPRLQDLTPARVQKINAAGLSYAQLDYATATSGTSVWQALGTNQLDDLSAATVASLIASQPALLNRLTKAQFQRLNMGGATSSDFLSQAISLSGETANSLIYTFLSAYQLSQLPSAVVSDPSFPLGSLTSTQVKGLTANQISAFSTARANAMGGSTLGYEQLAYTTNTDKTVDGKTVKRPLLEELNTAQLGALSADVVARLNASQFALLTQEKIRALNVSQLSIEQLRYKGSDGVSVLSNLKTSDATQWGVLPLSTIGQLNGDEIAALTSTVVSRLTPQQIAATNDRLIQRLSDAAVLALTVAQLSQLDSGGDSVLSNLTPAQIQLITPANFSDAALNAARASLGAAQVGALTHGANSQLAALSVSQVQALNFAGLSRWQIESTISGDGGTLWDALAVMSDTDQNNHKFWHLPLDTVIFLNITHLNQLSKVRLHKLNPAGFTGYMLSLTYTPATGNASTLLQALSSTQVHHLETRWFSAADLQLQRTSGYTIDADKLINQLTDAQLNALPAATLQSLTTAEIDTMTAAQMAKLSARSVGLLQTSQLTTKLLTNLSADAVDGLTATQIRAISTANITSLLKSKLSWLQLQYLVNDAGTERPVIDLLSANDFAALKASTVAQLSEADFSRLSTAKVQKIDGSRLTRDQLDYIDDSGQLVFDILTSAQKGALAPDTIISQLSNHQFSLLHTAFIHSWSDDQLAAIRAPQVSLLPSFSLLTRAKIAKLNAAGLTATQMGYSFHGASAGETVASALTDSQLSSLNPDAIASIDSSIFGTKFSAAILSELGREQVAKITAAQLRTLATGQVNAIDFSYFSESQLAVLLERNTNSQIVLDGHRRLMEIDSVSGGNVTVIRFSDITAEYLNKHPSRLQSMLIDNFINLNPEIFRNLTKDTLQYLTDTQCENLTPAQFNSLSVDQRSSLRKLPFFYVLETRGYDSLSSYTVTRILPQTFRYLNPMSFKSMRKEDLQALTYEQLAKISPASFLSLSYIQQGYINKEAFSRIKTDYHNAAMAYSTQPENMVNASGFGNLTRSVSSWFGVNEELSTIIASRPAYTIVGARALYIGVTPLRSILTNYYRYLNTEIITGAALDSYLHKLQWVRGLGSVFAIPAIEAAWRDNDPTRQFDAFEYSASALQVPSNWVFGTAVDVYDMYDKKAKIMSLLTALTFRMCGPFRAYQSTFAGIALFRILLNSINNRQIPVIPPTPPVDLVDLVGGPIELSNIEQAGAAFNGDTALYLASARNHFTDLPDAPPLPYTPPTPASILSYISVSSLASASDINDAINTARGWNTREAPPGMMFVISDVMGILSGIKKVVYAVITPNLSLVERFALAFNGISQSVSMSGLLYADAGPMFLRFLPSGAVESPAAAEYRANKKKHYAYVTAVSWAIGVVGGTVSTIAMTLSLASRTHLTEHAAASGAEIVMLAGYALSYLSRSGRHAKYAMYGALGLFLGAGALKSTCWGMSGSSLSNKANDLRYHGQTALAEIVDNIGWNSFWFAIPIVGESKYKSKLNDIAQQTVNNSTLQESLIREYAEYHYGKLNASNALNSTVGSNFTQEINRAITDPTLLLPGVNKTHNDSKFNPTEDVDFEEVSGGSNTVTVWAEMSAALRYLKGKVGINFVSLSYLSFVTTSDLLDGLLGVEPDSERMQRGSSLDRNFLSRYTIFSDSNVAAVNTVHQLGTALQPVALNFSVSTWGTTSKSDWAVIVLDWGRSPDFVVGLASFDNNFMIFAHVGQGRLITGRGVNVVYISDIAFESQSHLGAVSSLLIFGNKAALSNTVVFQTSVNFQINLDNFENCRVYGGEGDNYVFGSKANQTFHSIGRDTIIMSGGLGQIIAESSVLSISMANGGNSVYMAIGIDNLPESLPPRDSIIDGGELDGGFDYNSILFNLSGSGLHFDISKPTDYSDYSLLNGSAVSEKGIFKNFQNIRGTDFGDVFEITDIANVANSTEFTDRMNIILGSGINSVKFNNSKNVYLSSSTDGGGRNEIHVFGANSHPIIETSAGSVNNIMLYDHARATVKLAGESDLVSLGVDAAVEGINAYTGNGTHVINAYGKGLLLHVGGYQSFTQVNDVYNRNTTPMVVLLDSLLSEYWCAVDNGEFRITTMPSRALATDSQADQEFVYRVLDNEHKPISLNATQANLDYLQLEHVVFSVTPSFDQPNLSFNCDIEHLIRAMASMPTHGSAPDALSVDIDQGVTRQFYRLDSVFIAANSL